MNTSQTDQSPLVERARELLARITPWPWKIGALYWANSPYDPPDKPKQISCWTVQDSLPAPRDPAVPGFYVSGIHHKPNAEFVEAAPDLVEGLCKENEALQSEALKGICVYCGEIQEYESLEHKASAEGDRLRVEHIKRCEARPEKKMIDYVEKFSAAYEALHDACKQFVHWYAEDSTEFNRDSAYDAAVSALDLAALTQPEIETTKEKP